MKLESVRMDVFSTRDSVIYGTDFFLLLSDSNMSDGCSL